MSSIYEMQVPFSGEHAELINVFVKTEIRKCETCGYKRSADPGILRVEWRDGSDVVGDFVNAGAQIVAQIDILRVLKRQFDGFEIGKIDMFEHPGLTRPKKITKKSPARVWLPYEGPELGHLKIVREVDLEERSTVDIISKCAECGIIKYGRFQGIEIKNSRKHTHRAPGKGMFVRKDVLKGCDFFRPRATGFNLCTQKVKDLIETKACSKIDFLEVGDLI